MHYVHKLTPRQKKGLIALFVITPLLFIALLVYVWMESRGMFIESFQIKTVVSSAQGVELETPVSFSGIKIGWVTDLKLNEEDAIQVTMKIDENYHERIRKDSVAALSALGIIGKTELMIKGGSKDSPRVEDGDFLESIEVLEVENLLDRISPLISAGEKTILKVEKIVSTFPEDKFNSAVENLSEITSALISGKSTLGRLVSTDGGEFYRNINGLVVKLGEVAEKLRLASEHLPDSAETAGNLLKNAEELSASAKEAGEGLPEIQKKVSAVLDKLDRVLSDIAEITPEIKKNVERISEVTDEFAGAVMPKIPIMLDEVEQALNESLILLESIKSSWPIKNMVPPEKEKPGIDPSLRETPYMPEASP
jgi:phospholipid/cholesterol/gamma-HCH transport system substrate-binding protein